MRRAPAHPMYYPPHPQPQPRGGGVLGAICTVLLTIAALAMAGAFVWRAIGGQLPTLPKPIATSGGVTAPFQPQAAPRDVSGDIAIFNATQVASVPQAAPQAPAPAVVQPNAADPSTWPTAIIAIPTAIPAAKVTIVPKDVPLVVAEGSRVTPLPTDLPYPTPLPVAVASNYTLSPDGKCISAPRGGKTYQVCQNWKYGPQEIATVADLIRGGTLPGVEVK